MSEAQPQLSSRISLDTRVASIVVLSIVAIACRTAPQSVPAAAASHVDDPVATPRADAGPQPFEVVPGGPQLAVRPVQPACGAVGPYEPWIYGLLIGEAAPKEQPCRIENEKQGPGEPVVTAVDYAFDARDRIVRTTTHLQSGPPETHEIHYESAERATYVGPRGARGECDLEDGLLRRDRSRDDLGVREYAFEYDDARRPTRIIFTSIGDEGRREVLWESRYLWGQPLPAVLPDVDAPILTLESMKWDDASLRLTVTGIRKEPEYGTSHWVHTLTYDGKGRLVLWSGPEHTEDEQEHDARDRLSVARVRWSKERLLYDCG